MRLPTYADILEAEPIVHRYLQPTPLLEWPALSEHLGFRYLLKHENHNPTTAFKVRGGIYLVSRLSEEQKKIGILGCTTGNHGQSLAYASRLFNARCVLIVPEKNNPDKVAAMRALGAEVLEHGEDYDEAKEFCEEYQKREGLRYVHSADEPELIAGVGTYALEMFEVEPTPDVIFVPVGLGTGICGTALVATERHPECKVIGVQSEMAPSVTLSWREKKVVETETPRTFAEGMATRRPAELTLQIMHQHVHDMMLVSEQELQNVVRLILQTTHNLVEGAGAASTAAAIHGKEQLAGKTVIGIASGGNLDLRMLQSILSNSN